MNSQGNADAFKRILPFLREIEPFIVDQTVSEIMVNSSTDVFVERRGVIERIPGIHISQEKLQVAVQNIARHLGDDISPEKPILDSRLPDGSRIAAILPPCSVQGITLTIRKFNTRSFTMADLIEIDTVDETSAALLESAVVNKKNIIISGGTGTGKTTLLNILCDYIQDDRRLVVIEDTAEIHIRKSNVVRFEARRKHGEKLPAVSIRDLLKASLRHRPDSLILGEIRGDEAFDLLQALNTGHAGSLTTIHANSAQQTLSRLANCVLQSGYELPFKAIKANIADCINMVVHIERRQEKRFVSEILEVSEYNQNEDAYRLTTIYSREQRMLIREGAA